jgi:sulfite exporter TauE/SafE
MCGAFTCLYATRGAPNLSSQAAYNVGRLVSYVALGTIAGAFGSRLDVAGQGGGVANLAAVVAGLLMILWAAGVFAAEAGIRVPVTLAPEWAKRALGRALVASRHRSAITRALLVGLLTTLLPCGWLYTFVVVAAGTGSPIRGALAMVAFWAGTVPMLVAVGAGAARLLGPLARRMPLVSAGLVFALGAMSVAGKLHQTGVPHTGMMHVGR